MKNRLLSLSALSMALAVACGAFGAHALRGTIAESDLDIWEKAVLYHLVHGLAVLVTLAIPATLLEERKASRVSKLFLFGTIVFCGSLYTLVLTNTRWLGAITPIGGVCFMLGWVLLSFSITRRDA